MWTGAAIAQFSETLSEHFVIQTHCDPPHGGAPPAQSLPLSRHPGDALGSLLGVILACTVQGTPLREVILGLNYGYTEATGVELVDTLLLRGGIQG